MAGNALRKRDNWQTESGPGGLAGSAEKDLIAALNANLDLSTYEVNDHPTDLKHLYEHVVLSDKTLSETLYLIFDYPYKYYTFKHFEV
jgi:hypothetical protein